MVEDRSENNAPKIYYYSPDINTPSGGIKILYQHVDILNKHVFSAFILHRTPGFRCTWFENTTPVIYLNQLVRIDSTDCLVIPERHLYIVNQMRGMKKIIFNQGCYNTFDCGYSLDKNDLITPYHDKEIIAVLVVSDDSKQYLSYVFPELKVVRVHNAIDFKIFSYQENKKPVISFMTGKNEKDILQVINILKFRKALDNFEIVPIYNKTEKQVSQILKESIIFLSFVYQEGFSLPAAEAMACGCVVIGYHGMGGREFFKSDFSYSIPDSDIIMFVKTVENLIELYKRDKNILIEKGKLASQYILNNYSIEKQEKDVVQFWNTILR